VRFTGHVDDRELAALYKLADAFAFPSRFEGFGLPPLEAMAYGCPVIASRASAIPEVVGDAALLVPPTDVSAWVAGLRRVLLDAPLKQELIAKGHLRATKFPWRRTAAETANVYEELLTTKGLRYAPA
jgi:glycosyltransferase involved in cell wall biosynthesis